MQVPQDEVPERSEPNPRPRFPGSDQSGIRTMVFYLMAMLILIWLWQSTTQEMTFREIPYSEFKSHLSNGELSDCRIRADEITGQVKLKSAESEPLDDGQNANTFLFRTVRVEDPDLVGQLQESQVKFTGVRPNPFVTFFFVWLLPIALLIALWVFLSRRMGRGASGILNIGKSHARFVSDEGTGVDFDDVAGCDEAKYELQEVVAFLREPEHYRALGARIPKGVLLVGPPGTGKTLLARAVAGEAGVPFFSISGSDFVEMFVGVGAARVRDLFRNAQQKAPCIIFIDELDAIGRTRGVHLGAANDEREQTLNQLLVEMDGFDPNAGVILLSATNRPDVLDRALLRPGRFDRQVVVDAPDAAGREAILKVHTRNKPLADDIDLERVARATAGFSGADLANTLNEAALLAGRRQAKRITQEDLEEAIEKVIAGPQRKSRRLNDEDKRRVAYHEAGHALVSAYSEGADPVHKISIVPRGRAALGYTLQLPMEEQLLLTRSEIISRVRGMLGGRAAEQVVFGGVTTGASNDLEQATALVRQMICHYGMSEKIGLASIARQEPFSPADQNGGRLQRDCSEQTAREIDEEVKSILDQTYTEALHLLEAHRHELDVVATELQTGETLTGKDFYELIGKPMPEREPKAPVTLPEPALPAH